MQKGDKLLQVKRHFKKIISQKIAIMLKDYAEEHHPDNEMFIHNMIRQIKCSNDLQIYDNDTVRSYFCGQKTCLVCNSIRLAKFLDRYLDYIEKLPVKYHMVLSIKNPDEKELKGSINKMFKFFDQSSIKRNKEFRELNKKIMFIRSFETTFNLHAKSYNNHFHCLLGGDNESEVKKYGEIIVDYWLKYFKDLANRKAQYLEPQEKSILENFKYLFKLKDITKPVLGMVYNIIEATKGKRLFTQKNIKRNKIKRDMDEIKVNDIKDATIISRFNYHTKAKNWIEIDTGELFITDEMIKNFPEEMKEHKNYLQLKKFFKENRIKPDQTFPIKFDKQTELFQ